MDEEHEPRDAESQPMGFRHFMDSRREKIRALEEEKSLASQEILKLEKERADLREEYGVSKDSEEERQLRLLEK